MADSQTEADGFSPGAAQRKAEQHRTD